MVLTIDEIIEAFEVLKKKHSGDTHVVILDRVLTTAQAERLEDCSFSAAHTALEEAIEDYNQ